MSCPFNLRSVYKKEPDWSLILVYSDWLEQQGREQEAAILRWLYKWDHWPLFEILKGCTGHAVWWLNRPGFALRCNRYAESFRPINKAERRLARATLPATAANIYHPVELVFDSVRAAVEYAFEMIPLFALDLLLVFDPKVAKHYPCLPREVSLEAAIKSRKK